MQKIHFKSLSSTNDYVRENIENLNDKTLITADQQTAGKGRSSRSWISSEKNNLYFSLLLKPKYNFRNDNLASLTQYVALVLTKVFKSYNVDAWIKWPNDILVENKKISGVLTETMIQGSDLLGIVIGIGVNLNLSEMKIAEIDQPATSLNILLGRSVDKEEFLEIFLKEFFNRYSILLEGGFSLIKDEYIERAMFLGKKVRITVFDKVFVGIAKNIDNQGRLILDNNKIINIGDMLC
ncbi:MAG: biotin--[acetyl-CoA-carboxylase] ligase [bacterium]|nr:biotin--[acetyl-CoA-carboxylase] ligase [bacterium]